MTTSSSQPGGRQRYYFDTHDGEAMVPDQKGLELDGLEAARAQVLSLMPDFTRQAQPGDSRRVWVVRVRDQAGATVLMASLTLMVEEAG